MDSVGRGAFILSKSFQNHLLRKVLRRTASMSAISANSVSQSVILPRRSERLLNMVSASYRAAPLVPNFWRTASSSTKSVDLSDSKDEDAEVMLSDNCVKRLKQLQEESPESAVFLRATVEGGGCFGFQVLFSLEHKVNPDDRIYEKDGAKVIVDETSLEYLKGSTIDFSQELIRSAFRVISNPKAEQGCSCGSSFSVKL